jgi:hypothetical protein
MMKQDHNNPLNDDFDAFLRAQLRQTQPYVSDADFTSKLMAKHYLRCKSA